MHIRLLAEVGKRGKGKGGKGKGAKGKGFLFALFPLPLTLFPTSLRSLVNSQQLPQVVMLFQRVLAYPEFNL
ncbi:hypothetical protein VF14_07915 [Nostoc linckia z18]|uniref:Uncharacterized protein n=2 Tax=Nostoc linckia TaxID=92942 RepID=A0A9Q6EM97_NOSLI|nr:hypothetical protein VF02_14085 [Nostoc linckia z1]PHJ69488.1 hypothetical protein VF05_13720 [Nostoc linckia z3]PHJ74771.1 hypothetical protein VF03_13165 [Nostoc linckia z2]PHJ82496.1 hypothetical protein VF06_16165 [Nostoc linckia z4]PHJ88570.1 hypothetical protein VF07_15945 [Nostoc linckia z6]PHJ98611.1 hypothetical protein VF04_08765 [Nostoc linckia z7]PHK05449.1 hypothetical protein VF08_07565 [Nostoc linckia z8]PHK11541.1 hypothetical protein VF09_06755 [Nostoc linckia z9]PHK2182